MTNCLIWSVKPSGAFTLASIILNAINLLCPTKYCRSLEDKIIGHTVQHQVEPLAKLVFTQAVLEGLVELSPVQFVKLEEERLDLVV